jgi:hypothetical protein
MREPAIDTLPAQPAAATLIEGGDNSEVSKSVNTLLVDLSERFHVARM